MGRHVWTWRFHHCWDPCNTSSGYPDSTNLTVICGMHLFVDIVKFWKGKEHAKSCLSGHSPLSYPSGYDKYSLWNWKFRMISTTAFCLVRLQFIFHWKILVCSFDMSISYSLSPLTPSFQLDPSKSSSQWSVEGQGEKILHNVPPGLKHLTMKNVPNHFQFCSQLQKNHNVP